MDLRSGGLKCYPKLRLQQYSCIDLFTIAAYSMYRHTEVLCTAPHQMSPEFFVRGVLRNYFLDQLFMRVGRIVTHAADAQPGRSVCTSPFTLTVTAEAAHRP